jgi:hypothetical protein
MSPEANPNQQVLSPPVESLLDSVATLRPIVDGTPWPLRQKRTNFDEDGAHLLEALGAPLSEALVGHSEPEDDRARESLEQLSRGRFAFVEVAEEDLSSIMIQAQELFGADQAGLALRTEMIYKTITGQPAAVIDVFPALERDGTTHRLLLKEGTDNLEAIESAFGLLTFPSEVQATDTGIVAITELVDGAVRPVTITQAELDDWLGRLSAAGVELSLDVGDGDRSLDNLLRHDGRLYWCDGDIMDARAVTEDEIKAHALDWREVLDDYVED